MYKVIWDKKAFDNLQKLEPNISRRITIKVRKLEENPHSEDIKKLKGIIGFRLRIGDYRVIFKIDRNNIHILKVGHRRDIYKR